MCGLAFSHPAALVLSKPPLLLVVGMHRSGTSLLGGILERLGVELPGESILGDQHNPDGYFEWGAVVALQERLLIDLQRWWPAPEGALPLPHDWLNHPATRNFYGQLRALVVSAVEKQQGDWAIKDPVQLVASLVGAAASWKFPQINCLSGIRPRLLHPLFGVTAQSLVWSTRGHNSSGGGTTWRSSLLRKMLRYLW